MSWWLVIALRRVLVDVEKGQGEGGEWRDGLGLELVFGVELAMEFWRG